MPIYLDHNATTPLDRRVLDAMLPYLKDCYGNPSSGHRFGREAQQALQHAREQVASLVSVQPTQVVFTSGGTEANNLALQGVMGLAGAGAGLVVSASEHPSVMQTASALQAKGVPLAVAAVDGDGVLSSETLERILSEHDIALVSVMLANNETGVVQDIAQLSEVAKRHGALMHTDAVQALGKMPLDFEALGVSAMSLSAHKLYGPKGVGALVVDKGLAIQPLLYGGGHEMGLRAGTENLPGIVGFGAAAEIAQVELKMRVDHCDQLRRYAETALQQLPHVVIFAAQAERLPNTVYFAVPGIEGSTLLMNLDRDGIAVSSGSACSSGSGEPSHVLQAMGVEDSLAYGAVRVSFGKDNTFEEVDLLIASLQRQIESLLKLNAAWA